MKNSSCLVEILAGLQLHTYYGSLLNNPCEEPADNLLELVTHRAIDQEIDGAEIKFEEKKMNKLLVINLLMVRNRWLMLIMTEYHVGVRSHPQAEKP